MLREASCSASDVGRTPLVAGKCTTTIRLQTGKQPVQCRPWLEDKRGGSSSEADAQIATLSSGMAEKEKPFSFTVTAGPSATDGKPCFLDLRLPAVIGCHGRIPQFAVRDGSILLKSQGNANSTQGLYCFSSVVMMMIFS